MQTKSSSWRGGVDHSVGDLVERMAALLGEELEANQLCLVATDAGKVLRTKKPLRTSGLLL